MTIETLVNALSPPFSPVCAFRGPWTPIEAEIGATLPDDYKAFVRLYGSGQFLEFFWIHVPWPWHRDARLAAQIPKVRYAFANDQDLPYPLWPHAGGLLPCGGSDFGDLIFWLTRGPPEQWKIVFWDRGMQDFEVFDCDLTGFLAGVVTGTIDPKGFPSDVFPCDCLFKTDDESRPI